MEYDYEYEEEWGEGAEDDDETVEAGASLTAGQRAEMSRHDEDQEKDGEDHHEPDEDPERVSSSSSDLGRGRLDSLQRGANAASVGSVRSAKSSQQHRASAKSQVSRASEQQLEKDHDVSYTRPHMSEVPELGFSSDEKPDPAEDGEGVSLNLQPPNDPAEHGTTDELKAVLGDYKRKSSVKQKDGDADASASSSVSTGKEDELRTSAFERYMGRKATGEPGDGGAEELGDPGSRDSVEGVSLNLIGKDAEGGDKDEDLTNPEFKQFRKGVGTNAKAKPKPKAKTEEESSGEEEGVSLNLKAADAEGEDEEDMDDLLSVDKARKTLRGSLGGKPKAEPTPNAEVDENEEEEDMNDVLTVEKARKTLKASGALDGSKPKAKPKAPKKAVSKPKVVARKRPEPKTAAEDVQKAQDPKPNPPAGDDDGPKINLAFFENASAWGLGGNAATAAEPEENMDDGLTVGKGKKVVAGKNGDDAPPLSESSGSAAR